MPVVSRGGRRSRPGRWLRAGLGLLLLGGLAWQVGDAEMWRTLGALGWRLPLVLVPYGLFCLVDVKAWQYVFPPGVRSPSLGRLYAVRLAGESVNELTPTATVGGEPLKALLVRDAGVPAADAAASVVVNRTALTVGQVGLLVTGCALYVFRRHREPAWLVGLTVVTLLALAFVVALVEVQRRGGVGGAVRWIGRLTGKLLVRPGWISQSHAVDDAIVVAYREGRRRFAVSVVLHYLSWLLGGLEFWVVARLLGTPVALLDVMAVEGLSQFVRAATLVVPGGLGVQEVGGVAAFTLMGLDPGLGLAAMLLRRARQTVYAAAGLVALRVLSRWRPAPAPAP